ncbi:asparagine synthase (glutamine-hydrolyzing) [Leptothrix discophora]|uniref:asparagine synthase (glutamine-hydrolyzing) n=1 Tax=Leptothrix discophora TaxID=89 RepID=A0ABT9G049_LEPDI|nr:asparagine synthase (glutamine-hydrolyzing) [Leptothrix discophora]MDP4299854.1 asparagine synthase (glutamine-hydrolyzing) [Leptothrix discophora]
MCGILGISWSKEPGLQCMEDMQAMLSSIEHRGPDDQGIWCDTDYPIAIGHRRLSIIDLSSAGAQPMMSSSGRYVIAFNGEIYNHLDLRRDLERTIPQNQSKWRGHSDTETLLQYIEEFGLNAALNASVGMFGIALWDVKEKKLHLARDRIGEKPLYYGFANNRFVFTSELKAVKRIRGFSPSLNKSAISKYFRLNYIPAPETVYTEFQKVQPGQILTFDHDSLEQRCEPSKTAYWSLSSAAKNGRDNPFTGTYDDSVDQLEYLLSRAVSGQSYADVPVGAFLSGGVDSSLVAAMMRKSGNSEILTFSIGMPDARYDESHYAKQVATHLGTRHHSYDISEQDALDLIPTIAKTWDEPFADSSQIPTFLVSKLTRQKVKVALSGDGGDEFFWGYSHYGKLNKIWRWRELNRINPTRFGPLQSKTGNQNQLLRSIKNKIDILSGAWSNATPTDLAEYWADKYKNRHTPLIDERDSRITPNREYTPSATPGAFAFWDASHYLPDDILVKVDRASMANSLETRAPLLDHRVIEFSFGLPDKFKATSSESKIILKSVLERHIPRHLIDRPKMGFSIPLDEWLRTSLRPWCEDLLHSEKRGSELLDNSIIRNLWTEHCSRNANHADKIWAILMFIEFTT